MSIEASNPLLLLPFGSGHASSGSRGASKVDQAPDSPANRPTQLGQAEQEDDSVALSPEAEALAEGDSESEEKAASGELSESNREQIRKLEERDKEVRAHEAAHLAAAGPYAEGGAHFDYQAGPNGKRYAIGGHVNIDVAAIPGDPQATIAKAKQVRRAALAPVDPSSKDRQVAARAAATIAKAQAELRSDPEAAEPSEGSPDQPDQAREAKPLDQTERPPQPKASGYVRQTSKVEDSGQYLDLSA